MRFKLDGEQFELEGVRWPVRQTFAMASGVNAGRFVSTTTRRHFANLGFSVSAGSVPRSATPALPPPPKSPSEPLMPADTESVEFTFTWMTAGDLSLNHAGTPAFPTLPHLPGLNYLELCEGEAAGVPLLHWQVRRSRWTCEQVPRCGDEPLETATSRRIHKELMAHLAGGGALFSCIATEVTMGGQTAPIDLRVKSARRLG